MKLGVMLGMGLVILFAGLANFWIGDIKLGLIMIAIFGALAGVSALIGKREYEERRSRRPPLHDYEPHLE
jgi:membrane protein implicated in regulation of membrane protease activity